MRIFLWIFGLLLALPLHGAEIHFNFGDYPEGATPTNFQAVLVGDGQPGVWKIIAVQTPSLSEPSSAVYTSRVLAQTSTDPTDEHFPMLLFSGERFRDFKFTTRFKIVSGVTEQMAGVVFRYQNSSNYYVVRASALGDNVRFYKVVDGVRSDPIGSDLNVAGGVWHTLGVQCEGNQINIFYDDKLAMPTLGDNSFTEGLIGFRTKSDTVCYFTDAQVDYTPIVPASQLILNGIVAKQTRILALRIYTQQPDGSIKVVASKDPADIGKAGTDAEANALKDGTVSFGRGKGIVELTLPLHDCNGEFIAAVRVRLKSFFAETQDNALVRARLIVEQIQKQVSTAKDLL